MSFPLIKQTVVSLPPKNQTSSWRSRFQEFCSTGLAFTLAVVALLWIALWNGFPDFDRDTPGYLRSAARLNSQSALRPIWYGLLLNLFQSITFWGVVILQAILVALFTARAAAVTGLASIRGAFTILIPIALLTAVSVPVGKLSPDFLTSLLFLGMVLVLFDKARWGLLAGSLFVLFAVLCHLSHIAIAFTLAVFLSGFCAFRKPKYLRRALLLVVIVATSIVITAQLNRRTGTPQGFTNSWGAFVASRLYAFGTLDRYLDEHCATQPELACEMRSTWAQGQKFLWGSESPVKKMGGWIQNRYLEDLSLRVALAYPGQFLYGAIKTGLKQLITFRASYHVIGLETHPNIVEMRATVRGGDVARLDAARAKLTAAPRSDDSHWLPKRINRLSQGIVIPLGFLVLLWLSFRGQAFLPFQIASQLTLLFITINAFVCGAFAGPIERYQARVVWLVPFLAALFLLRHGRELKPTWRVTWRGIK